MPEEEQKQDIQAFKYPHDSAGRLMTRDVPRAKPTEIVREVRDRLLKQIHHFETINYVYVVNGGDRLVGILSIKDLLRHGDEEKISVIMKKDIATAKPHSDQEHIAYLALRKNIKAVPIVNKDNRFVGVVPSDKILDIMYTELSEDIRRLAGIHHSKSIHDDVIKLPILLSYRRRVPWLFVGLLGGILVASVIGLFESALKENIILAAFIPLIVYMSDAVGTQMEAFIVRDLAISPSFNFPLYLKRHLSVVALIALTMSGALYLYSIFSFGHTALAYVLSIALFATIISSVLTGLLVPYAASKMRIDPADVSGPIATTLQDFLSILIYFSIATILL